MYHKLVVLPIQWEGWLYKLVQKVDLKGWPRRLGRSGDRWLIRGPLCKKLSYEIVPIRLDPLRDQLYDLIILQLPFFLDARSDKRVVFEIMALVEKTSQT